ncbi:MAG: dihydroneopterin aldolase [Chloroflexi bacterium]|nr:dihydroneopterin aldolase [Chloroflexota bacterium]
MSDRIVLHGLRFEGRHGVGEEERSVPQLIELDVELELDLTASGQADDLTLTVDYGPVIELCRHVVEDRSFGLLEAIGAALCGELLDATAAQRVTVRVRKPAVPVDADLDYAAIEMTRERA